MTPNAEKFDAWIRSTFVELNTELEEIYFRLDDPADVQHVGVEIKRQIEREGDDLIKRLAAEGNTDEGFEAAFDLLGNLGLYLASMRRHELTNPTREQSSPFENASVLGLHIASSIGVVPRFATSHLTTHNRAVNGVYKTFTSLADERTFIEYNTIGILCFKRAAASLRQITSLGISNPVASQLFHDAGEALRDVLMHNGRLFEKLDTKRFFYNVRPYYKPYRVGRQEYRGANAGDFSGINEIDLLLGLCQANDPAYSQILVDKMLFMMPEDQASLRHCLKQDNFLDQLLDLVAKHAASDWFQDNARAYLEVCALFGETAQQHHNQLVKKFIERPAKQLSVQNLESITASGPPLPKLLNSLQAIRDLRLAANRDDVETRYKDLKKLRSIVSV